MNTEEKIKVMQAFVDGEKIEWAVSGDEYWTNTLGPTWNWTDFKFRIKSNAKEMTVGEIERELGYTIKVVK